MVNILNQISIILYNLYMSPRIFKSVVETLSLMEIQNFHISRIMRIVFFHMKRSYARYRPEKFILFEFHNSLIMIKAEGWLKIISKKFTSQSVSSLQCSIHSKRLSPMVFPPLVIISIKRIDMFLVLNILLD